MNREIYRWLSDGDMHEYRFLNGVCEGFFSNDVERHKEQNYKGRKLTETWKKGLQEAGFLLVN